MLWLYAHLLQTLMKKKRACPRCGRVQFASKEDRNRAVRCKYCGAAIPPRNHSS